MSVEQINDKVTVETHDPASSDHAAVQHRREEKSAGKAAAERRAAYVAALETERAYLERQPKPNRDRLAQVAEQLDVYAEQPARRVRETAVAAAPAKKAAAPRKRAAKKAAAAKADGS